MADSALYIGIDSSTTACKVIAWDAAGAARSEGRAPIPLRASGDAYEQDARDWWKAIERATVQALAPLSSAERASIRALAIANQRETFVVTDNAGAPRHRALVWMDHRCGREVTRATEAFGAEWLHRTTGKYPCTTPSFYKLLFLLDRLAPELNRRDIRIADVHGFLCWQLTGEFSTSRPAADPTGMIDLNSGEWSEPLLEFAGIERAQLPALVEPGTVLGTLRPDRAAALGLPRGLPVVAGAGDGQAAGLGAGVRSNREAYLNLGTAVVSGVPSQRCQIDPAFRTLYGAAPGSYFLETDLQGGTFIVNWLLDTLLRTPAADRARRLGELERAAEQLPPGAQGLVAVPYWNGVMNPYWNDRATGLLVGLRGTHGPEHVYRSIIEGIALEQRLHTEGVETATGVRIESMVVVGGGAASRLFCQIVASALGKPLDHAHTLEASALGAGILAARGAGAFATVEDAQAAMTRRVRAFEPDEMAPRYEALYEQVYRPLYPGLATSLERLRKLDDS